MNNGKLQAALSATLLAAGLLASAGASAITWNFSSNDGCNGAGEPLCSSNNGNSRQYTSGSVTVTATAWSDTDTGSLTPLTGDNRRIETAYLGHYSGNGLGVTNRDQSSGSPSHAIDNNGRFDAVRLAFSADVRLTDLYFGWDNGDTDFTVLYWTGSGSTALAGETYQGLAPEWALLNHYDSSGSGSKALSNTSVASRYWLVLAYNNVFSGATRNLDGGSTNPDEGDDYFKLGSVTAETPTRRVPEPGSLALLGLGLVGLGLGRRRR